jgi:hypothetical protein
MKHIIDGLTDQKSQADKREFMSGVLGREKFRASSFAGGFIAGYLLAAPSKPKKKKNDK